MLYADDRLRVYDDYGHHPNEIRATLRAFRRLQPHRLLVAFQPHRYSRTQHLLDQFAACFTDADHLWLTEIYSASERPIPGVSGAVMANAIRAQGQTVDYVPGVGDLAPAVSAATQSGDVVLFLGAGDITDAAHRMADQLRPTSTGLGRAPKTLHS